MEAVERNREIGEELFEDNIHINSEKLEKVILTLSKENFEKIKAGAFYNNYDSLEVFIIESVINEIEVDKQRHLRTKQGSRIK